MLWQYKLPPAYKLWCIFLFFCFNYHWLLFILWVVTWNWSCPKINWKGNESRHLFWWFLCQLSTFGLVVWCDDSQRSLDGHHPSRCEQTRNRSTCSMLLWRNCKHLFLLLLPHPHLSRLVTKFVCFITTQDMVIWKNLRHQEVRNYLLIWRIQQYLIFQTKTEVMKWNKKWTLHYHLFNKQTKTEPK